VAKSHVLVVDDEELYRRSLGRILSRVGHQVSEARDAAEALSILAQGGLDLVVADVRMPGLNGLELVRQIHEIEPDLPCIVVTGYGSAESSIEALRAGAFWYLEKPFDQAHLDVVRRLVEQAIEHGRSRRRTARCRASCAPSTASRTSSATAARCAACSTSSRRSRAPTAPC
jgi:DNA-binding NtrC family response regulator